MDRGRQFSAIVKLPSNNHWLLQVVDKKLLPIYFCWRQWCTIDNCTHSNSALSRIRAGRYDTHTQNNKTFKKKVTTFTTEYAARLPAIVVSQSSKICTTAIHCNVLSYSMYVHTCNSNLVQLPWCVLVVQSSGFSRTMNNSSVAV